MMHSKKILLADSHEDSKELVELILNQNFKTDLKLSSTAKDAMEILDKEHDFDLIISDLHVNSGHGLDLFWHAKKHNYNIPFIFFTGTDKLLSPEHIQSFKDVGSQGAKNILLSKPFEQESLVSLVKYATKVPMPLGLEIEDDRMLKVSIQKLLEFNICKVRASVKIGANKYIGVTTEDDTRCCEIFQKYLDKNVEFLYLDLKYLSTLQSQTKISLPKLLGNLAADPSILLEYQINALDLLYSSLSSEGIGKEEIHLIESIATSSFELIKKHTPIWNLFKESEGKRFISKHSLLLAHISCHYLIFLNWSDQASLKDIFIAALLHDLAFGSDSLALIHDLKPQSMVKLAPKKVEEIKGHIKEVLDLLAVGEFNSQIVGIVENHHENALASGYPHQKSAYHLNQLDCVFILAHEILNSLLINNFDFERTKKISLQISKFYSHGAFVRPLEKLSEFCDKLKSFQ